MWWWYLAKGYFVIPRGNTRYLIIPHGNTRYLIIPHGNTWSLIIPRGNTRSLIIPRVESITDHTTHDNTDPKFTTKLDKT